MNQQDDLLEYYKAAYEKEKQKNNVLAGKLADAQTQIEDLDFKLKRIKNNPFWKLSKPVRSLMHLIIRTKDRIVRYGNPKGIARKLKSKAIEKKAQKKHGRASFPTKEQIEEQSGEISAQKDKIEEQYQEAL